MKRNIDNKKLKMITGQYIKSTKERKRLLEEELIRQTNRERKYEIRAKFNNNPTIRTIEEKEEGKYPTVEDTERYYEGIYKKKVNTSTTPTPTLNKWLTRIRKYTIAQNLERQVQREKVEEKIKEIIKKMPPWKATGENRIPVYIYKILPAARQYLIEETKNLFVNKSKLREADVRATTILIF